MGRRPTKEDLAKRIEELEQEVRDLRSSGGLMRNSLEKTIGIHVPARDEDVRTQAEAIQEKSEEHYRTIFENTGNATILIGKDSTILLANSNFAGLTGYTKGEIEGKISWTTFIVPEDLERMKRYHAQRREEGGTAPNSYEFRLKNRYGEIRDIFVTVAMIPGTSESVASCMDITDRKRAENALRRSEERYRGILDSIDEAYFEIDLKGNYIFANAAVHRMLGYDPDEIIGLNYRSYLAPETARSMFEVFNRIYRTGNSENLVDYEIIRKDGSVRVNEMNAAPLRDTSGNIIGFRGVGRDVTLRKKAEEELRKSEERYRGILDSMEEAYYEVDLKGNFTFFNSRAVNRLGYTIEELSGMNYRQYMGEESARKVFDAYHRVFMTGESITGFAWELKNRQGQPIFVEASISLRHDDGGRPIGFRGVVRDITERKKAEEALRTSEEKYRGILESMQESYYEVDLKGNFTFFNDSAMHMSGYSREELLGMNYNQYSPPETARRMFDVFHTIYKTGRPELMVDYVVIHKDGSLRDNELSAWPMRDASGAIVGFHTLVRDVTERKRAERNLRLSEERWQFALEGAGDGIWDFDIENKKIFRSRQWKEMLGYAEDEISDSPDEWSRLVHPNDRRLANEELNRHFRGDAPVYVHEHRMRSKDGSYKWILDRGKVISWSEDGRPLRIIGTQADITERKQAEADLRESERKYRLLAENLRDVVWVLDTDLKYIYVSPSVLQLRGYTPEEAMQQTMDQVIAPGSYQKAIEAFSQERLLAREGYRHAKEWARNIELELIRKDGSTVWTDVTVNILYDERGYPAGLLGISRDITERKQAEESLRLSEERYRTLFDGMMDGVYRSTHDGRFVDINQAMVDMFRYASKEEMLQVDIKKELYFSPDDRETQALKDRHGTVEIHCMRRRDGSAIWVEDHARYVNDEHGHIVFHEGTLRDVTERKKGEEALRKSEELYRTIFESTATANIIVSEDTTIVLANSNFEKLVGYSREELEGKMSWTAFVVEEDLEVMRQRHTKRRTDPDSVLSAYEFRAKIRSGEIRNMYMSVSMIPGTKDSVSSIIDITDRKKADDALKQSEERFRDLARLLPETVFETDVSGKFTFVNESSLERFGYTQEDMERGVSIMEVMAPHEHERVIANYQRVMQGERLGLSEYTAQKKDGTTFPALVHTTPIYREGRQAGLRGFLIDVTEKKSLEEQLMRAQKLEAIGTLAGGIAHDFNNLLMGILGNISLMLMNFDESHPFHDRLKSMEEYVQRGSDLTKQLLGFARGGKYEVKSTDLGEFVRRSAEMFGRTKKEIRMHHKASDHLWAVEVDRGQMEQVMLNLFVNSWQAMPGGGDLYLSVENAEIDEDEAGSYSIRPGRFVKLTITDTGVGMDEATKARIFEPFFSTKERGRGTGLGLASVYGIIKNHGGVILVESEKDIGTSFSVYLPASEKSIEKENRAPDQVHKGRETVLIVDDEDMIVEVGASMLEGLGYRVLTATGGRQGLQVFDQNKGDIDLVILDMIMPDFGGKETFEALRRQDPEVKVLLSSGYSFDGQAKEILAGGCRGFIQKPFTMAELSKKIREIIDAQ